MYPQCLPHANDMQMTPEQKAETKQRLGGLGNGPYRRLEGEMGWPEHWEGRIGHIKNGTVLGGGGIRVLVGPAGW